MSDPLHPPIDATTDHCTDTAEFLRILHCPGDVFEVRIIDCPDRPGGSWRSTAAGWFMDAKKAAREVERIEKLQPPAVYVSLNPVNPMLMGRAMSRISPKAKSTTKDGDILRRRWLFVDIDAVRPAGISSTDAELAEAAAVSDAIAAAMAAKGWPVPLVGMSGNGRYLLWRIDLPPDDESTALIEQCLKTLAQRFNTDGAEIDCSTFNAGRICKVLGTVARKGDELLDVPGIEDRPHRRSWFIAPSKPLQVVLPEQLQTLAMKYTEAEQTRPAEASYSALVGSDAFDRCCKYLDKMEPAVSGELGSRRLYQAACVALHDFGLSGADAAAAIERAFNPRCVPPWERAGIDRAIKKARIKGGPSESKQNRAEAAGSSSGMGSPSGASTSAAADGPWDDPISIDTPEVGPFPVGVLPGVLGDWVEATAEATQVPSELPGLLALAACSGAVARKIEIVAGRGWREPINLYVCCLLDPANRKSAVFREAFEPIAAIESELIESAGPDVARALAERRMIEAQAKKAEAKAAAGDAEARQEALGLAERLATEPVPGLPRLLVDDASAEAVELELARQSGRLIVAGPEGGLFDIMAGRYSSGVGNLDCFLKGHAGDDLRVDRVTRGSINVRRCCLTLAYAVQPEVIRGLADKPSFRGRGLVGRFLYALPANRLGARAIDPAPVPDAIRAGYAGLVRSLHSCPGDLFAPSLLLLSPEAADCFVRWRAEVEPMLADDGRLAAMRDWGGKLCGLTARLAAVIHLVRFAHCPDPASVPVGIESIESAIALSRWAIPHAEAAIGLMAAGDGSLDDASYVLRWLRERALPEVTRRAIYQYGRARFTAEPLRLDRALGLLVDRGWLRPDDDRPVGPGRPSVRYLCHPSIAGEPPEAAPVPQRGSAANDPAGRVRMVI